jgi:hypothetical protein
VELLVDLRYLADRQVALERPLQLATRVGSQLASEVGVVRVSLGQESERAQASWADCCARSSTRAELTRSWSNPRLPERLLTDWTGCVIPTPPFDGDLVFEEQVPPVPAGHVTQLQQAPDAFALYEVRAASRTLNRSTLTGGSDE